MILLNLLFSGYSCLSRYSVMHVNKNTKKIKCTWTGTHMVLLAWCMCVLVYLAFFCHIEFYRIWFIQKSFAISYWILRIDNCLPETSTQKYVGKETFGDGEIPSFQDSFETILLVMARYGWLVDSEKTV